jgi:AcrR family transcriptional regulator
MYHDGMSVPRQGVDVGPGRVNQKRRTRAAIVVAARALLDEGTTPTVAHAAQLAEVSRTTAYRYFPTQDSLLLEVAAGADVDDIEALVQRPLGDASPVERTLEVMRAMNHHVVDDEVRYRTLTRLYLDLWLSAAAAGDEAPVVREGRRRRWIEHSLTPALEDVPEQERARLVAALTLLTGPETVAVLRDVAQLSPGDAVDTAEWAARTLIDAALADR